MEDRCVRLAGKDFFDDPVQIIRQSIMDTDLWIFPAVLFDDREQISVVVKSIPTFSINTIKCFAKEVVFLGEYTRIPNRVRGGTAPFFCLRNTAKYRTFLPPNRKGWRFFDTICNEMQSNICF